MNAERMSEFATSMRNCETRSVTRSDGYRTRQTTLEWSYEDFVRTLYSDKYVVSELSKHIGIDSESHEWMWCFSPVWMGVDSRFVGLSERVEYLLDHGLPEGWSDQMMGRTIPSYFTGAMVIDFKPIRKAESMATLVSDMLFTGKQRYKRSVVSKGNLNRSKNTGSKVSMSKLGGIQYDRQIWLWVLSRFSFLTNYTAGKFAIWFRGNKLPRKNMAGNGSIPKNTNDFSS